MLEEELHCSVDLRQVLLVDHRGGDVDLCAVVGQPVVEALEVFFEVVVELFGDGVGRNGLTPIEQPASGEDVEYVIA